MTFNPEAFGKYYLVDKIAVGGMAEIFKAKTYSEGGFENLLVIKRILAHLSENDEFVEMFIDEAKVSVALQHPNIVRLYDFGKILDNYFIAMECVEGKDVRGMLRQLARKRKFLPVEYAVYIVHEACKGLDYAHSKTDLQGQPYNIVHRDISPSNILLSYEGEVKVADFGIAKAEKNAYETGAGVLKGKFEYMSPEQAYGKDLDGRSDVFCMGIILWEMLTGRRLFKTKSETETLEKVRAADVAPPETLNSRVPKDLSRIVMKALTGPLDQRYQSAGEMREELARFLYPATPDQTREGFRDFMQELFSGEIAEERQRLEDGSVIAEELHKNAPPIAEWDGQTNSTMAQTSAGTKMAMGSIAVLAVIALVVAGIAGYVAWDLSQREPEVVEKVVQVESEVGEVAITVTPKAKIFLDDAFIGEHETHTIADVAPGEHKMRLEADGYKTFEGVVDVVAGQVARFGQPLEKKPAAKPRPRSTATSPRPRPTAPAPAGTPGTVKIVLTAGGWASVYIDDERQKQTAPRSFTLEPGTHKIRVEEPTNGYDFATTITVGPGEEKKLAVSPI
ncbi:MAG: PEGA domain-containing protein [Deltaproteobacteria bacterium]|nr:MAG: PEGA domain-containing protein [Deltaproteobacteria bacterium]